LVEEHAKQTESALALRLLNEWDVEIGNFWQVVPTEIIPTLDKPIDNGQSLEQTA
jgi:glutamate synthase (NADPH/NADH) large chain